MRSNGIGEDQITQVRGFADQHLRKPDLPLDPSNRRISLIVQYQEKPSSPRSAPAEKPKEQKTQRLSRASKTAPRPITLQNRPAEELLEQHNSSQQIRTNASRDKTRSNAANCLDTANPSVSNLLHFISQRNATTPPLV
jgi:hypothetical protein